MLLAATFDPSVAFGDSSPLQGELLFARLITQDKAARYSYRAACFVYRLRT